MPNLCVFDPDGVLPLSLQRDRLATDQYPFEDMLAEDVSRDFLAFLIVNIPSTGTYSEIVGMPKYPGYSLGKHFSDFEIEPWVIVEEGLCPFTTWNLWNLDFDSLLLRTRYRSGQGFVFDPLEKVPGVMPAWLWFQLDGNARSKRAFLVEWLRDTGMQTLLAGCLMQGKRLITSSSFAKYFGTVTTYPGSIKRKLSKESDDGKYCCLATHDCPNTAVEIEALPKPPATDSFESAAPLLIELFLRKGVEPKQTILERLWKENIDYPVIPFDLTRRRAKLAKAYQTLNSHIKAHEAYRSTAKRSPESAPS